MPRFSFLVLPLVLPKEKKKEEMHLGRADPAAKKKRGKGKKGEVHSSAVVPRAREEGRENLPLPDPRDA